MKKISKRLMLVSILVLVLIIAAISFTYVVRANAQAQNVRQEFFKSHPGAQAKQTDNNADNNAPSQSGPSHGMPLPSGIMDFVHNTLGIQEGQGGPAH